MSLNPDEQTVERHLMREVTKLRGFTIKIQWIPGFPDRIVFLPRGVILFVELKRPKDGSFERFQPLWLRKLKRIGCNVFACWSKHEVDYMLAHFRPSKLKVTP